MTIYMQWVIKVKPYECVEQLIVSELVVCGDSNHTRAALLCDMRPHKPTQSDTISCSTYSCGFPIICQATFQLNTLQLMAILLPPDAALPSSYIINNQTLLIIQSWIHDSPQSTIINIQQAQITFSSFHEHSQHEGYGKGVSVSCKNSFANAVLWVIVCHIGPGYHPMFATYSIPERLYAPHLSK